MKDQIIPPTWALKIRMRRERCGLSQRKLAERMGVAVSTVQRYEYGKVGHVYLKTIRLFAIALRTTIGYLCDDEETKNQIPRAGLSGEEKRLIECYRRLDKPMQRWLLALIVGITIRITGSKRVRMI